MMLDVMMMTMITPQVALSNLHHSGLAGTDPVEGAGLAVFILGPFPPLGAGCGIERSCPSTVSIFLSSRRHDAFSASVSCRWITSAGSQPASLQLRKWVRELQSNKTSQTGL